MAESGPSGSGSKHGRPSGPGGSRWQVSVVAEAPRTGSDRVAGWPHRAGYRFVTRDRPGDRRGDARRGRARRDQRTGREGAGDWSKRDLRSCGEVLAVAADVGCPDDVERLVGATREAFGHIDVLVNNAALANPAGQPARLHAGALGRGHPVEPDECLPVHAGGSRGSRRRGQARCDRQHQLVRCPSGPSLPCRLRCDEGRHRGVHPRGRARARPVQHPRQCRRARRDPDRDQRRGRGVAPASRGTDPGRAGRRTRGDRDGRGLPGVVSRLVRHRADA